MRTATPQRSWRIGAALAAAAVAVLSAGPQAAGQTPRLDYAHPVAGETLTALVDRAPPGAPVDLLVGVEAAPAYRLSTTADASGTARFELFPVERGGVGTRLFLRAVVGGAEVGAREVLLQAPQLLLTGVEAGAAYLYRVPVFDASGRAFPEAQPVFLGSGVPGGAVRDGRGTRTYVIADAMRGVLRVVPDDSAAGEPRRLLLPPGLRGIASTADGTRVLVTSEGRGGPTGRGVLTVVDTRSDEVESVVELDPLGAGGGRLAVTPDGLRAFVAVQGLYVREVLLVEGRLGALVAAGRPGHEAVRDLRLIDGRLVVLTGPPATDGARGYTALELADLRRGLQGPLPNGAALGLGRVDERAALLFLDGAGGLLRVLDADTFERRADLPVPAGASALLLTPDPSAARGALLYPDGVGSDGPSLVPLQLEPLGLGDPVALDFVPRAVPVLGESRQVPWLFLANGGDGVVAFDPETLEPLPHLDLPLRVAAVSIGR